MVVVAEALAAVVVVAEASVADPRTFPQKEPADPGSFFVQKLRYALLKIVVLGHARYGEALPTQRWLGPNRGLVSAPHVSFARHCDTNAVAFARGVEGREVFD